MFNRVSLILLTIIVLMGSYIVFLQFKQPEEYNPSYTCLPGLGAEDGDQPSYIHRLKNNQAILFCGYSDPEIPETGKPFRLSEFQVIFVNADAKRTSLKEFGTLDNYLVEFNKEGMPLFYELQSFPVTHDEPWLELKAFAYHIDCFEDTCTLRGPQCVFDPKRLPLGSYHGITELVYEKHLAKRPLEDPYITIRRLLAASLNGQKEAESMLFNLSNLFNFDTQVKDSLLENIQLLHRMRENCTP